MDVWKVSYGSTSCYLENESDARSTAYDGGEASGHVVTKEKMHREVFEKLSEFNGF